MPRRTTPKKKLKRTPPARQPKVDWHKALSKQTKAALVGAVIDLIKDDDGISRRLMQRFRVEQPPQASIGATRQAIADATAYDPRQMNRNFAFDYEAYDTVRKNLEKLVAAGRLESAMDLALELMDSGSEQVEMSDEGLMTDDIEECLRVVIKAVGSAGLPADTVKTWARKLRRADRVGFICDKDLKALAGSPEPETQP